MVECFVWFGRMLYAGRVFRQESALCDVLVWQCKKRFCKEGVEGVKMWWCDRMH